MAAVGGAHLPEKWTVGRNTALAAGAMGLLALGEHLWRRFLPKYLEALGAPILAIGAYGSTEDFLDAVYQYPGGWIGDRYGRRAALLLFITVAAGGYGLVAAAPSWPVVFAGMALVLAWSSMASPALFAIVGDSLPSNRRALGFSVQAILRRLPIAVAPVLGGLLVAAYGVRTGVRAGLAIAVLLAAGALLLVRQVRLVLPDRRPSVRLPDIWRSLPTPLRRLLLSDVCIRTCEGMVEVFLVIYALDVVGLSAPRFGLLIAAQTLTSIASYLPMARLADSVGRKPLVVATFLAFSLFPLAVATARGFSGLLAAFVIGGLREMGEPARKALIVDLVPPETRARGIGLYYLIRSLAITPAAILGGLLWKVAPPLPFFVAAAAGLLGTALFALTVEERYAG